ncbi:MAG: RHS repeat-associated core domain-containing protein [Chitinophagaceae bacterium]
MNTTLSNRLQNADFYENGSSQASSMTWGKTNMDLSEMGINYDPNGNILTLKRFGPTGTPGNFDVDDLTYTYMHNGISNQLEKIEDAINYQPATLPYQDFQNGGSGSGTDYTYDPNGNMQSDANKDISTIEYSYLNKPLKVTFGNGSYIEYSYSASGEKLEENTFTASASTLTHKVTEGGIVYEENFLKEIQHAEGVARHVINTTAQTDKFEYDFHIKDHLGNVRTIVTAEEMSIRDYIASHEVAYANLENLLFDNIPEVRAERPGSGSNESAAELDGNSSDKRVGTSLMLHVMAGDKLDLSAEAYYYSNQTGEDEGTATGGEMLESILNTLLSNQESLNNGEFGTTATTVQSAFTEENFINQYQNILQAASNSQKPQAFLNYLFFDENFNLLPEQSGAIQVNMADAWHTLSIPNEIDIRQGGYAAIYISNYSKDKLVYFDNLYIQFTRGILKEENHYYPYGMNLKISSQPGTSNNTLYQSKELNRTESLNWYNFDARQYDPLIGRFTSIDPAGQYASGYVGMGNNPVSLVDPTGMYTLNTGNYKRCGDIISHANEPLAVAVDGIQVMGPAASMYLELIRQGGGGSGGYGSGTFSGGITSVSYGSEDMGIGFDKSGNMVALMRPSGGTFMAVAQNYNHNVKVDYLTSLGASGIKWNGQEGYSFITHELREVAFGDDAPKLGYLPHYHQVIFKKEKITISSSVNLQSNGGYNDEKWLATDIMGTIGNGTMVIDGAFNFVEHSKTGRFLANGYQHISKVEMAQTLKLAKPLTRGIAVVNFAATATAVTDDLYHGRYKSAGARTAVWGIAAGATFIPVAGWGIAIGIGIADAIWGDDFYEYVEKNW